MKEVFLGIDTSCYTTSCALVDKDGNLLGEARKLLEVPLGKRGLQQSQMVFQHTRALPTLIKQLPGLRQYKLSGIGVSGFPRRELDSYMPAFLVGKGQGETLAHLAEVPLYVFSHQENHVLAALRELGHIPQESFLALHLSGGTTEVLFCEPEGHFFKTSLLGGGDDLNAGQFVDRVGVAMGLPFPAGPSLEALASSGEVSKPLPVAVKEGHISFGGPCSEAMRRLEKGVSHEEVAASVFTCIAASLEKMLAYHMDKYNVKCLIAVGGVMSNQYLRRRLACFMARRQGFVYFASPKYSGDNASGVAYGAAMLFAAGFKEFNF